MSEITNIKGAINQEDYEHKAWDELTIAEKRHFEEGLALEITRLEAWDIERAKRIEELKKQGITGLSPEGWDALVGSRQDWEASCCPEKEDQ